MPSRKRSKGKERKARQAESRLSSVVKSWEDWFEWSQLNDKIQCSHGNTIVLPSSNSPQYSFVESLLAHKVGQINVLQRLGQSLANHTALWKEEIHRYAAIEILTTIITNRLLFEDQFGTKSVSTKSYFMHNCYLCTVLLVLENYDGGDDIHTTFYQPNGVASRVRDLNPQGSNQRDVLKFMSRRITCPCLKRQYAAAKRTYAKVGACGDCSRVFERSSLLLCGGCRIDQYCSRECQIKAWSDYHKADCNEFIAFKKKVMKNVMQ